MKKYLIHFIYLIVIALLAIFSRVKSNELSQDLAICKQEITSLQQDAEELQRHAKRASEQAAAANNRMKEALSRRNDDQ